MRLFAFQLQSFNEAASWAAPVIKVIIAAATSVLIAEPAFAQAPPAAKKTGPQMEMLTKKIHACLDRQALAVAPKPVDLETASVAIMARCAGDLDRMRQFLTTGIPNFTPGADFWLKEIEPVWLKEARKKVALARTRDLLAPVQRPTPAPQDDKNKI
jgi:hypothetical protein